MYIVLLIVAVELPIVEASDSPQVGELQRQRHWAPLKIQALEERLRLQRINKYGPASAQLSAAQLELLETEPGVSNLEVQAERVREPLPARAPSRTKGEAKHPGRQPLPAGLPRVERTIVCAPEQCPCPHCGQPTEVIG